MQKYARIYVCEQCVSRLPHCLLADVKEVLLNVLEGMASHRRLQLNLISLATQTTFYYPLLYLYEERGSDSSVVPTK